MPRLVIILVFAVAFSGLVPADGALFGRRSEAKSEGEYLIVSGGPALREWEKLRKEDPHDVWWGNFVRAARFRMTQLIRDDPNVQITWLVYMPAYQTRQHEDAQHGGNPGLSRIENIRSVPQMFARDYKRPIRLIWFDETQQLVDYINDRGRGNKIIGFEYFGHSNAPAFMFDYSNAVSGASRAWLHESDLGRLRRRAFDRDAYCKSWGCYSAKEQEKNFCRAFRKATGVGMWGATGKTDYSVLKDDKLPVVVNGRWLKP